MDVMFAASLVSFAVGHYLKRSVIPAASTAAAAATAMRKLLQN